MRFLIAMWIFCLPFAAAQTPASPEVVPPGQSPAADKPAPEAKLTPWERLEKAAVDGKPEHRIAALAALASMTGDREAAALIGSALLHDDNRDVRQVAALSLGDIRARAAIPALRQALNDKAPEVVFAAAQALWKLGDRTGRDILEEVLDGERSAAKGVVSSHLAEFRKLFTSPKQMMVFGLKEGAGSLLGPYAMGFGVLQEFMSDKSAGARVLSVSLLAQDPNATSFAALRDALRDKSWLIRLAAAKAAGGLRRRELLPILRSNLDDADERSAVKLMCAAAVLRLEGLPRRRK